MKNYIHKEEAIHIHKVAQMQKISMSKAHEKYSHLLDARGFIQLEDLKYKK